MEVRQELTERLRRSGAGNGGWDGGDWDGGSGGGGGRGGRGRRGGSERVRRKGDWWRHWTWKKVVTVLAAATGAVVMLAAVAIGMAYSKTPIPDVQATALQQSSTVYFGDGKTVVGKFGSTNRIVLTYNDIPPLVRDAVVAAEDKHFWHEGGISPTGIVRAAYNDITNSGGNLQGGSTITQQLVRNYYDDIGTAQTFSRKIKEIFVAEKLARSESKAWILTRYLNTIYFGDGAYGIGAAAETYFGLPVSKLTVAQAAMLAAMIQQPSGYSPNPKAGAAYQALVYRWHYVLNTMVSMGTLSAAKLAKEKFPHAVKPVNNSWSGYRGYIMQAVQYELEHTYHFSQAKIDNGGLSITTTINKHLMNSLQATVRYDENRMRHCDPPGGVVVTCKGLRPWVHVGAVLEQPGTGAILAMYGGKDYNSRQYDDALQARNQVGSSFKPYVLATAVKQGMNVRTSMLNGYAPLWIPPDTQPMTKAKLTKPFNSSQWFKVTNDEIDNSQGPVSVVRATAESLNTAFTDLWHRVAYNPDTGGHPVVDMAKAFGVNVGPYADGGAGLTGKKGMQDEAGTALGQASLTVEEQATMIATLAAGGEYATPHLVKKVVEGTTAIPAKIVHRQVLTASQAADVDYALSFDFSPFGTASSDGLTNGQTVIAKTGTTNLSQSAFFLGATQRNAMAVGMFVSHPGCKLPASEQYLCTSTSSLSYAPPAGLRETLFGIGGEAGYGGQWPATIWHDYFMRNFNKLPPQAWPPPNNDGKAWNMIGQRPTPKPTPTPTPSAQPTPTCNNNGHWCRATPNPTPSVFPTPTASASPTPTCTTFPAPCPSSSPAQPGGGATKTGGTAAGLLFVGVLPVAELARRALRTMARRRRWPPSR
jgi:membrane peptidoglycan carboxypeptidase